MALAQQRLWQHDGSPFILARPLTDLTATMQGHGYTVYSRPNVSHQLATPAEDHCPYSQTPWPGPQPYPHGMAADLMPHPNPTMPRLAMIGARMYAAKQAGGLVWLKYMNWTDVAGQCWHDSWQPSHARRSSTDRGHIHWSVRTDHVNTSASGYDPIALTPGREVRIMTTLWLITDGTANYWWDGTGYRKVRNLADEAYVYLGLWGGHGPANADGPMKVDVRAGSTNLYAAPYLTPLTTFTLANVVGLGVNYDTAAGGAGTPGATGPAGGVGPAGPTGKAGPAGADGIGAGDPVTIVGTVTPEPPPQ